MVKVPLRTYVVALVSVGLCGSTLLVPAAAGASAGRPAALTCKAKVSNAHPKQYTSTTVEVHTAAYGAVTTVAHYKSTNTTHKARQQVRQRRPRLQDLGSDGRPLGAGDRDGLEGLGQGLVSHLVHAASALTIWLAISLIR